MPRDLREARQRAVPKSHALATRAERLEAYGRIPLSFEANVGQVDPRVRYISRGAGYGVFLTDDEIVLSLARSESRRPQPDDSVTAASSGTDIVRLRLVGSNHSSRPVGEAVMPGTSHYYSGNDPSRWRTRVPNYARVRDDQVYDGIDLVLYGNQRQLEYDFVVAPGADPGQIRLDFSGIAQPTVNEAGDLVLRTSRGTLLQKKPLIYQEIDGHRTRVEGRYVRVGTRQVGIDVADYDGSQTLVIDPTLAWSTFLGGGIGQSGLFNADDFAHAVAVDTVGNVYVAGDTTSTDFPTRFPFQATSKLNYEAFVTKIDASGNSLIYSTYLGGAGYDQAFAIAADGSGNADVAGTTTSGDFPITGGVLCATCSTLHGSSDAFVATFDANGALTFSSFLGGTGDDAATGIAVNGTGVYVAGNAGPGFPTSSGALHATSTGGPFITKLAANHFVYSTYLYSAGSRSVAGIAVDSLGAAYVAGTTGSGLPVTPFAYQTVYGGGVDDAFVAKLSPDGSALVYSTYLGGSGRDEALAIAVDGSGNAYVAGEVLSTNFPTVNALQPSHRGGVVDGFVTELDATGQTLIYSTYLGGGGVDIVFAIAVDGDGSAYVAGSTTSPDFPVPNAIFPTYGGFDTDDAFVAAIAPGGSTLNWSTYLGGRFRDRAEAIAVDSLGSVYVAGWTNSGDFPTLNSLQSFQGNVADAFITKIRHGLPQTITVTQEPPASAQYEATFPVAAASSSGLPVTIGASGACFSAGGTGTVTVTMTSGTGTCTITFDQAGDPTYERAAQVTRTTTADKALTTLSLQGSPNPVAVGGSVTFQATITPLLGGTASGMVTFLEGGVSLGTGVIAGNIATFTTTALGHGAHGVYATYDGDTNLFGSTSNVYTEFVGDVADLAVSVTANPAQVARGANVTLTATVQNNGPANATTAFARVQLPSGLSFVSATPAATYDPATGNWAIGALANGASVTLQIVATLTADFPEVTAQIVSADQLDSNLANNTATVTVLAPGIYVDATCSLRSAIVAANTDAAFGGCPAGKPGLDVIFLPPGSAHEYTDVYEDAGFGPDALPAITSPIQIEGRGSIVGRSALAGSPAMRVFFVKAGGSLTLRDVTVRNGVAANFGGGGILLEGTGASLAVDSARIVGNSGSPVGGGIANRPNFGSIGGGNITITSSVIAGNSTTSFGGGISTGGGSLTITNTTIGPAIVNGVNYPGNSAVDADFSFGGGLLASTPATTITGGTITGNSATNGGGLENLGYAVLTNVTIGGNHSPNRSFGGIDNRGALTLIGCTVSGNAAIGFGGGIGNLFQNFVGADAGLTIVNSVLSGNTSEKTGGAMVTYGPATLTNTIVGGPTAAYGNVAKLWGGGIDVREGGSLTMTGGAILNNTANDAPSSDGSGAAGGGIANGIVPSGTVTLTDVTLDHNHAPNGDGGAVFNAGTLNVIRGSMTANTADFYGGALANGNPSFGGGTATLTDVTISDNTVTSVGGGIASQRGILTLSGGLVATNRAGVGGGISTFGDTTVLTNTVISGNTGQSGGGGLASFDGTLTLIGVTVADNHSPGAGIVAGGGLSLNASSVGTGTVTIGGSTIRGNTGSEEGGIGINAAAVSITRSTISGNTGTFASGALDISNAGGSVAIADSTIADNHGRPISSPPGGIHVRNSILSEACFAASVISDGFNLFSAGGGCPAGANDITVNPADLFTNVLAPLADNGGPTETHALLTGSPAIDAGAPACSAVDQRGVPRPQDGNGDTIARCDIGSFESAAAGPAPATHFVVTAPASATPGTSFTFSVTALDATNNPTTNYSGTAHFTSSDGAASLPANATLTNGTGTFSATLQTIGTQTITATDTVIASITGTSGNIDVAASVGPATHFLVSAPISATIGAAFTFTVTALDAANNIVIGYGGTVHFTSSDGPATLPANATLVNGTRSFTATLATIGSQTITGTDTVSAAITGTSNLIDVSATPPLPPSISKQFAPASITVGRVSTLRLAIVNPNASTALTGVSFTDPLPAGLLVASAPNVTNTCGGTVTGFAASNTVNLSGGTLPGSGSCLVTVDVTASSVGTKTNVTGSVGSTNGGTGNSASADLTVTQSPTTTTAVSAVNPSVVGQSVTFTASVTGFGPTGTVTFFDGLSQLGGSQPLAGGTATLSTSTLSATSHSITAVYGGDANNTTSTSTVLAQIVKAVTTTTVVSSLNPSTVGQSVTFTATVSGANPIGDVTFTDGATTLGVVTLSAGTAALTTGALSVGNHSIVATYGGDPDNLTSASVPLTQVVRGATTTVTLVSSLNPSTVGQSVTLTATVTGLGPTGTVTFFNGVTSLGTVALVGGSASVTPKMLGLGSHPISASYSGDGNNAPGTSATLTQIVNKHPGKTATVTTLVSSPNPSAVGQVVTFTATVTGNNPTGTVTFKDGPTVLGTAPLVGGVAILKTPALKKGKHQIDATYSGDSNNHASKSPKLNQQVK